MSALPLFRRALADSWRGLLGWMLGLAAVVGMYLPLYPSIGGNPEFIAIIESLPPELVTALSYDQITTGSGYTLGTVHGLIGFVLLTIAAVGWGASAIAGDEERGTLELTLAHGVSRHQLVLERLAAIVVKLVALTAWVTLLVAALNGPSELDISTEGILAGGVALLGIDSVMAPIDKRQRAWARLARDLDAGVLAGMTSVEPMSRLPELSTQILEGQTRGRVVIDVTR